MRCGAEGRKASDGIREMCTAMREFVAREGEVEVSRLDRWSRGAVVMDTS